MSPREWIEYIAGRFLFYLAFMLATVIYGAIALFKRVKRLWR